MTKLPISARIKRLLRSFENPLWLHKRSAWLYWRVYNFSWSGWYWVFENRIAKISPMASAVGYFIYLNDILVERFGFEEITGNTASVLGLSLTTKLSLVYFGLLLVAAGRVLYLFRRPNSIRYGPDLAAWVNRGIRECTFSDFNGFHQDIRANSHRSPYGRYYDDDWEAFRDDATWSESGRTREPSLESKRRMRVHVDYAAAKLRHEDLLRSILTDRYFEYSARRKLSLFFCLLLGLAGFAMFFLPNLDLLLTILTSRVGS
jgi:hypothetical protein